LGFLGEFQFCLKSDTLSENRHNKKKTTRIDDLVKGLKRRISVIPAKAGIQFFPPVINFLDSGFHRSDDFLREHQVFILA